MGVDFPSLLEALEEEIGRAPAIVRASNFWQAINARHKERLAASGLANFKRTMAKDYFTWMRVLPWDSQIRYLVRNLPLQDTIAAAVGAFTPLRHAHIPLAEGLALNFLTRLIWRYAEREAGDELSTIAEHAYGNPPEIFHGGRLISQDIANSVLEYRSFAGAVGRAVCELGGGYGRNAFVVATMKPATKYIMVDIPPAIGIAQEYLTTVFRERRHFRFCPFENFEEVRSEFEEADFAYLLPHQMAFLPKGSVDLFVNISSLHEMRREQVDHYLTEIKRLVRPGGHFYLKAWKISNNPTGEFGINADDYDLADWRRVFWRTAKVQTRFFEALLARP